MRDKTGSTHKKVHLKKPFIAHLFQAKRTSAFSEKLYHKKAPHCLTKNNNHIGALHVQKFVRLQSPLTAHLSDGSGAAQYALKTSRANPAPLRR